MTVGMKWPCPSEPDALVRARHILEAAFTPAPDEEIAKALYAMRRMTRGREGEFQDEVSAAAEIETWVGYLKDYPADVAISVIQDWPKVCMFRPTWFDIRERLEQAMSQRRVMLHALVGMEKEQALKPKRLNAKPETDEDRARTVTEILGGLIKDCGMGPFRSMNKPEDTLKGRVTPIDEDMERRQGEVELRKLENDIPRFHLSDNAARAILTPEEKVELARRMAKKGV